MSEHTAGEQGAENDVLPCRPGCKPGGACRWIGCHNLPATPDVSKGPSEEIGALLDRHIGWQMHRGQMVADLDTLMSAAATKARAEERERIAQAIEALPLGTSPRQAARIARLAPDTAGGDR